MRRQRLLDIVANMRGQRLLVVGDLVVDRFLSGTPKRVSREAPVLILQYRGDRRVPGGGANSVHNIHALGGIPLPVGVVGEDAEGEFLLRFFAELEIDVGGIRRLAGYRTPAKVRILGGGLHGIQQQIVRYDIEPDAATLAAPEHDAWITSEAASRMRDGAAGVLSDYGYGLLTPGRVAAMGRAAQGRHPAPRLVLDSRYALASYSGIAAATPNEEEAELATGIHLGDSLEALERAGGELLKNLRAEAVLVTRGSRGMALFTRDQPTALFPVHGTDQVADVTGAGDTVISAFALALAAGASYLEATLVSNFAGGIVVMKAGTATVSNDELSEAIATSPAFRPQGATDENEDGDGAPVSGATVN